MRKGFLLMTLLFIILLGACACSSEPKHNSQSISTQDELYAVSDNLSLKVGTNFDGETVLGSADFIGFNYKFNESQQEYSFTFRLTDKGREKMTEATTELAETHGDLSLWMGDELISSPKVMEPITGDSFAVNIVEVDEDNISDFVDKLKGISNRSTDQTTQSK